jgi:PEP-CTERM motif
MNLRNKLSVLTALLACTAAHAGLLGETVRYQRYFPNTSSPAGDLSNGNYLVGDNVEVGSAIQNSLSIDIADDQITLVFHGVSFSSLAFNGFGIEDAFGSIDDFTSFELAASSVPFASSRVTFDADHLWVNLAGLRFNDGDRLQFSVGTGVDAPVPAVPEPSTWALFSVGMAAVWFMSRRRANGQSAA